MAKKEMVYKDETGHQYKISYSEELQLKNLQALKRQISWEKRNFYAKVFLILIMAVLTVSVLYVFYTLDQVNFFTRILSNR